MSNVVVHIPVKLKTWGGRKVIIGPSGNDLRKIETSLRRDEKLINTVAKAYRWQKEMSAGKSAEEISKEEGINSKSYVLRMVRLMFLSPQIINAVLQGMQPDGFSLRGIDRPFSPVWEEQERDLGFTEK